MKTQTVATWIARGMSIVAVLAIFVFSVKGSDFPAADQVFLPSAISIKAPWGSYISDIWLTNESDDPVSVSMTYTPANAPPLSVTKRDVVTLAPHEHREITDIVGMIGGNGFGPIVFNGCLSGADCSGVSTANYRNISVQSRIYIPGVNGGTVGQNLGGIPWHAYGDSRQPLTIVGIRASDQYRTNIGAVNGSDSKSLTLTATLYDGASHAQRDQVTIQLLPSEARQQNVTAMFPLLGNWSRLNRGRAATNAYVVITSNGNDDAFFAYGSLIDATTNDATTLEATHSGALTDAQIASLYGMPAPQVQAAVRLQAKSASVATESQEQCMARVTGPRSKMMPDAMTEAIRVCAGSQNSLTFAANERNMTLE